MGKNEYEPYEHAHIKATICNLDRLKAEPDHGRPISFPISNDDLQQVLLGIGCTDTGAAYLLNFECSIDCLCDCFEDTQPSIEDINALASTIHDMGYNQYWQYEMVMAVQERISGIRHAINIALNIDKYDCHTDIKNPHDLGQFYAQMAGQDRVAGNEEACMQYGTALQKSHSGVFTSFGYVCQTEDWTQFYKGEYDNRGIKPTQEARTGVSKARPEPDRSER